MKIDPGRDCIHRQSGYRTMALFLNSLISGNIVTFLTGRLHSLAVCKALKLSFCSYMMIIGFVGSLFVCLFSLELNKAAATQAPHGSTTDILNKSPLTIVRRQILLSALR